MSEQTVKPKKRRVLVYGQTPPPYHGSNIMTEVFLKSLEELDFEAVLTNKLYSKKIDEVNRITLVKAFRFLSALKRFYRDLKLFKPDLVVFFISATKVGLLAEGLFTTLIRIHRIPYVLYIHVNGHREMYSRGGIGRGLIKWVFNASRACFVLGKVFEKDIGSFYKKKIFILPNCLIKAPLEGKKKKNHSINVLYLSNLYETKGIFTLLRAVPDVVAKNKKVHFLIAGPWPDKAFMRKVLDYVKREKLDENVHFLGAMYGVQKEKLFQESDIFVFPSHYRFESFGLVNLEAMQAGIPVITTNIGALPEMVIDGKTGFIILPQDSKILAEKINVFVEKPGLRCKMGREGMKRFQKEYSFQAYSSNVNQILEALFFGT